jgi:hypothetical protein
MVKNIPSPEGAGQRLRQRLRQRLLQGLMKWGRIRHSKFVIRHSPRRRRGSWRAVAAFENVNTWLCPLDPLRSASWIVFANRWS